MAGEHPIVNFEVYCDSEGIDNVSDCQIVCFAEFLVSVAYIVYHKICDEYVKLHIKLVYGRTVSGIYKVFIEGEYKIQIFKRVNRTVGILYAPDEIVKCVGITADIIFESQLSFCIKTILIISFL